MCIRDSGYNICVISSIRNGKWPEFVKIGLSLKKVLLIEFSSGIWNKIHKLVVKKNNIKLSRV